MGEAFLAHLISTLKGGPESRREWYEAIRALGTIWPRLPADLALRRRAQVSALLDVELMAGDAGVVRQAIRAFVQVGGPTAATAIRLARLLGHDDEGVVRQAIAGIGRTYPDAVAHRLRSFLGEPVLSAEAADALSRLRAPDSVTVKALIAALGRDSGRPHKIRRALASVVAADPELCESAIARLRPLAVHPREQLRSDALRALALMDAPGWPELCAKALDDASALAREHALIALITHGTDAHAGLVARGVHDREVRVRKVVAECLIRSTRAYADDLLAALSRDRDPEARSWATWSVWWRIRHSGDAAMHAALRDEHTEIRRRAAVLLATRRDPAGLAAVRAWLRGTADERSVAVTTLCQVGGWPDVDPVTALLRDEDPRVRRAAAFGLGSLLDRLPGRKRARRERLAATLTDMLGDPDRRCRSYAADTLHALIGDRALPALREAIADGRLDAYAFRWLL